MDIEEKTKLLGVIVNNKLARDSNTAFFVNKQIQRLLHELVEFRVPDQDMLYIYILYI